MPNEIENFFGDLPAQDKQLADVFSEETTEEDATEKVEAEETPEKGDEPRKNRRHRRLEAQLEKERVARIEAEARAKAYEEARNATRDTTSIDERLVRLYGEDNAEAARLHMELLRDYGTQAKKEALDEFREERAKAKREQEEFEAVIDTELESIEDEFDVDVTSDAPAARKARREFLELVQKLSPKDNSGEIISYADFHATWELYQARKEKAAATDTDRAKEVAARTMQKTTAGQTAPKQPTPGFRGWQKDFNIKL